MFHVKTPYKIRLAGIDAPESRQAFGQASKQHLSALVYKKPVIVLWDKKDRYGRTLGKVMFDFTESREGLHPLRVLGGYAGYLQADAYRKQTGTAQSNNVRHKNNREPPLRVEMDRQTTRPAQDSALSLAPHHTQSAE